MDVVTRYWQIFRALALGRVVIVVLLGLFYLLGFFLASVTDGTKMAPIFLVLSAIPACGFIAIATERVVLYSDAGAVLGVPRQAELLRIGQGIVLIVFVAIPAAVGLLYGAPVSLAALLLIPAAIGVLIGLKGHWLFAVWIALALGSQFFGKSLDHAFALLGNPAVRCGLVVASTAVLYWWLGLPSRVGKPAAPSRTLADARHEANAAAMAKTMRATEERIDALEAIYDREIAAATAGIDDGRVTSRAVSLGMAIDVRPSWRGIAKLVGFGWVALLGLHLIASRGARDALFLWVVAFAAIAVFSSINALRMSWQSHAAEEALLTLSPRWPGSGPLKRIFAELILKCQTAVWLGWMLSIVPFFAVGWLNSVEVGTSILVPFAASCGGSGALLLMLSLPRVREPSVSAIASLLCAACGVAVFYFGVVATPGLQIVGFGIVVLPLAVGIVSFSLRTLQFPAVVVNKQ